MPYRLLQATITALVLSLAPMAAIGDAQELQLKTLAAGTETVVLPMQRMALTERDGQIRYVSGNGRYVFEGRVLDTWEQIEIKTPEDAKRSAGRVNLDAIGFDLDFLVPVTHGQGPEQVIAFVDDSEATAAFLDVIRPLEESHTFHLIFVPQNTSSARTLVHSACPSDHDALLAALFDGSFAPGNREVVNQESCRGDALQHRDITATFLDLHALPAVIRADSAIHRGRHPDWRALLTGQEPR